MRSFTKSFYGLAFLFVVAFLSPIHFVSANTPVLAPVERGKTVTIHWVFAGGVTNCSGDFGSPVYPDNSVKSAWKKTHATGGTLVSFSASATPGSYPFTCTNLATGVTDSATLTITDCSSGTHWSGSSCVANSCSNGALSSSYPSCNQCPDGQYYKTQNGQCTACSGTGCTGVGGTISNPIPASLSCLGGATNPIACNAFAPSCSTLSVNKSEIIAGETVRLTWGCQHVSSCTEIPNSDGFSTSGHTSGNDGSVTPSASSGQVIYGLACDGLPFYFPPITILVPTATITANPIRIRSDQTSIITWSASNVSSCIVTNPSGAHLASGNADSGKNFSKNSPYTTPAGATGIYTITCNTVGGGADVSSTVTVSPQSIFTTF
ncbi:MAG: hypothetical protein NUV60_00795 [Patescibacteria group bacterium]|nr:hypothetical protein [Patescibacteria group bacterium]